MDKYGQRPSNRSIANALKIEEREYIPLREGGAALSRQGLAGQPTWYHARQVRVASVTTHPSFSSNTEYPGHFYILWMENSRATAT